MTTRNNGEKDGVALTCDWMAESSSISVPSGKAESIKKDGEYELVHEVRQNHVSDWELTFCRTKVRKQKCGKNLTAVLRGTFLYTNQYIPSFGYRIRYVDAYFQYERWRGAGRQFPVSSSSIRLFVFQKLWILFMECFLVIVLGSTRVTFAPIMTDHRLQPVRRIKVLRYEKLILPRDDLVATAPTAQSTAWKLFSWLMVVEQS